jgi:hypothetical protein
MQNICITSVVHLKMRWSTFVLQQRNPDVIFPLTTTATTYAPAATWTAHHHDPPPFDCYEYYDCCSDSHSASSEGSRSRGCSAGRSRGRSSSGQQYSGRSSASSDTTATTATLLTPRQPPRRQLHRQTATASNMSGRRQQTQRK